MRKSLAVAALACTAGTATVADVGPVDAVLVSVKSYSVNGSAAWNRSLDTSTWAFDTANGFAVQTGGTYSALVKAGATPLMRHTMTGVTLGNFAPTGTTWACIEGNFGTAVGASICGNYNFGANLTNESTYTPTATGATVIIGGDDGLLGPPQTLVNSYSSMLTTAVGGGVFCLSNGTPTCSATSTTGFDFLFQVGGAGDTTPDPFSFTDQTGVALSTPITSNAITVSGIDTLTAISVVGGQYSINAGTFTAVAGTVSNGNTVTVRQTSSAAPATATNATLTIGVVSDTFTVTTVAADMTPDAFTFSDQSDVPLSSVRTSNAVSITGINTTTPISVVGGTYSINAGTYVSSAGTVGNNDIVSVRHTSSASFSTGVSTTLTVGGVSDTFTSTTLVAAPDTTPDPFVFTDQTNVAVSAVITSNAVTITGTDAAASIAVAGGEYSIGCTATFTAGAATINPGQTVCVRHTSAAAGSTPTNTILTVGGTVADTFTSTTGTTAPNPFSFTDVTGVALSALQTSNTVTITGITVATPISVSGGQYSIGCTATFTSAPATITNGQTVCVRHTSSANNGVAVDTVLTVGGVSDTYRSTTASDTTPDPFSFNDQIQQPLATLVTSNTVTISGIDGPAAIAVIGGEYAIGCTTFTSAPGTITNGQTVCVRHITAATNGGRVNTQLTVGGVAGIFFTTTVLADPVVVADTPPSPTPAVDPPVILFDKTAAATAATIQDIGIETDGLVTGGTAVIGFCTAIDPRETEGPGATYNPRPLPLSELAGTCSSLAGESLVVPAYMRPIPDALGVRRFVFSTANTTVELEGVAVSQGYGEDIVTYLGNVSPPCNVPLSSRPLWLWGVRAGEEVDGVLTNENQVMKPTSIQCNAARSATRRFSNFIQNVSLDETLYSSASYLAGQSKDLDTVLNKLDADDNSCSATLQSLTTAMRTQAAICRTATVFAVVTRDTSVAPVRINRTVYQYAMKVKLRNYGGPVTSAQAVIRSGVPSTVVTGGVVTKLFPGGIGAGVGGGYAETAAQSFTIQQDRLLPVNVGVLLPAVSFVPDLVGANANRYPDAVAGCEQLARLAKQNRPAFDSCPANIRAKKYRGALIGGGLGAAFTTYDRLARPVSGGTWSIYPLPTDIIEPGQIPPGP